MNKQELIAHTRKTLASMELNGNEEDAAICRAALVSLEAKPAAMVIGTFGAGIKATCYEGVKRPVEGDSLYTAPPAPDLAALVPDEMPEAAYVIMSNKFGDSACMIADDMWDACRAEMLRRIEGKDKC